MLATFAHDIRKNFSADGTSFDFLPLESFANTFARTKSCVVACRKLFATDFARFNFGVAGTFGNFFARRRTIRVVSAIDGLKFFAADRAGERGFFMRDFSLRVNSLVFVFGDKLKVGNVVVVVIEVKVMHVVTVGNFAVEVRPNKAVKPD